MSENTIEQEEQSEKVSKSGSNPEAVASPVLSVIGPRSGAKSDGTMRRRNVLGRGLSALMSASPVSVEPVWRDASPGVGAYFPEIKNTAAAPNLSPSRAAPAAAVVAETEKTPEGGLIYLSMDRIVPSRVQPRQNFPEEDIQSLSASIAETGLLQPIIVRRSIEQSGPLTAYEIVAGERRWRAAKTAGLRKIPALVRQLSDKEALEFGIIENVQRADLNPIEEAHAYQRLISEFGATQDEVARTVSKDRTSVANSLRLLKLPEDVQEMLIHSQISSGHGRALLMLDSADEQLLLANRIVGEALSVRAVEQLVGEVRAGRERLVEGQVVGTRAKEILRHKLPAVLELEERFRRALGTKVHLTMKKSGKGELRISFFSQAELESLLERFGA
jgi:ParB family transcriptional regulator, chromosome partitioning protein